jgi:hypothetical protein
MASNYTPSDSSENISEASSSSSTSKVKDEFLNDILMCGICLSRMTSPCCLPCAHSFCRSCLLDYAQNNNTSTASNFILCPYCKYQLNFRSFEHFESLLIINPVLKQLCEALDTSKMNSDQQPTQPNGTYRARCHTCCLLKMLKICKHCYFMLCETCRRTHLLDVHRESKVQLDLLESRIHLINKKRLEMDKQACEYDDIRQRIDNYVQHLIHEIEQQRDQALQILNQQQHIDDVAFWTGNGFDNGEKLDFFISLLQTGQKKLLAKNITDKDLMELSDNLQTMPDVNEKLIDLIQFSKLLLELDESFSTKQFIRVYHEKEKTEKNENLNFDQDQTDCVNS